MLVCVGRSLAQACPSSKIFTNMVKKHGNGMPWVAFSYMAIGINERQRDKQTYLEVTRVVLVSLINIKG
jgi:hypothetical protein